MWFLRSRTRSGPGEVELKKLRTTLGSSESADIRVDGLGVEPIHAILEQSAGVLKIFDLATSAGTSVNGMRVAAKELAAGDRVGIGSVEFILDTQSKANLEAQPKWERESTLQVSRSALFRERDGSALEWVHVWNDHLLNVEHFALPIRRKLAHWLEVLGDEVRVSSPQRQEDLLVYRGGALTSMSSVVLKPGDLVKVIEGARASWLSLGPQLPELIESGRRERDPLLRKAMAASLVTALLIFLSLFLFVHPDPALTLENSPEHIVKLLAPITPPVEPLKETVIPAAVPLPAQQKVSASPSLGGGPKAQRDSQALEGKGAKAAGPAGKRGSPNATRPAPKIQNRAVRPSEVAGAGRGGSRSQSDSIGNVDLLQGAGRQIENLLGQSSKRLGATGGTQSRGTGREASVGNSGLATQGAGAGGGGDQGLEGLATSGMGAGKVGTGFGAAGRGTGVLGGGGPVVLTPGQGGGGEISGGLSPEAILAAIMRHRTEFQLCYERELNMGSVKRSGTVFVTWEINGAGRTIHESAPRSTLGSEMVSTCVLGVLRRIAFPKPAGGSSVYVKEFPFKFSSLERS